MNLTSLVSNNKLLPSNLVVIFFTLFAVFFSGFGNTVEVNTTSTVLLDNKKIIVGAEQLSQYLPLLTGKRVGLVVNQTSRVFNKHLVDRLLIEKVDVEAIFAPEHGFRGDKDAGEQFDSGIDHKTGIKLISLYGKNKSPTLEDTKSLDIIIFDIQDVGVRYYTYISTMHYMMEAAADAGIKFIVLDRPNPNGKYVDGPILEKSFSSFVGMHPIPLLHGMTVGELARMIEGEQWLKAKSRLDLTVIPVKNYKRSDQYILPVKPSPNLPNPQAIALYSSLGFFESTPVSIGRGTPFPFQVIGHDNVKVAYLNTEKTQFTPITFKPVSTPGAASKPKLMNKTLVGEDLRNIESKGLDLNYIIRWYQSFKTHNKPFFSSPNFMDKLAGTDKLRKAIIAGQSEKQITASWQDDLMKFKQQRAIYLLYP